MILASKLMDSQESLNLTNNWQGKEWTEIFTLKMNLKRSWLNQIQGTNSLMPESTQRLAQKGIK